MQKCSVSLCYSRALAYCYCFFIFWCDVLLLWNSSFFSEINIHSKMWSFYGLVFALWTLVLFFKLLFIYSVFTCVLQSWWWWNDWQYKGSCSCGPGCVILQYYFITVLDAPFMLRDCSSSNYLICCLAEKWLEASNISSNKWTVRCFFKESKLFPSLLMMNENSFSIFRFLFGCRQAP